MQTDTSGKYRYHGQGGDLFGLVLLNGLFTLLTLGIYSFWAKNKVREFHYSHTELDGDRFAYHGTGGELFRGGLIAGGIFLAIALAYAGISAAFGVPELSETAQALIPLLIYAALIPLVLYAVNSARRYRLSRSSWRSIRFSYHGDAGEFLIMMFKGVFLSIITLGFYTPFFQNERRKFLVNHVKFGSEPFTFEGEGRALFYPFIIAVLLTIPTFGLCWLWYAAAKQRHFWNNTRMRGARFEARIKGMDMLELQMLNMLLAWITLGIGIPWVIVRTHQFYCERLSLVGVADWASIHQQAQQAGATSEGLAEGFDVDVGIG
jgi:uncharacterized membrane protein YjgN (DUF898 family)